MIHGLNPQKIQDLSRDLNSPQIAVRFLSDFLGLLPQRLERIQAAVSAHDYEDAMDAVLSLTITAAMTGAADTEACCIALQGSIRNLDFGLARSQTATLAEIVTTLHDAAPALLARARRELGLDGDVASCVAA